MAIVTGFTEERFASQFREMFMKDYGHVDPELKWAPDCLKDRRYRYEIDEPEYRLRQLACVAQEFSDITAEEVLRNRVEGKQTANEQTGRLTVWWDNIKRMDTLKLRFPDEFDHVDGVDVAEIDRLCYDKHDEDDDRNLGRIRDEKQMHERQAKLLKIATELNIPADKVQQVLHESRLQAYENLTTVNPRSRRARKARELITVYDKVPKRVDMSPEALSKIDGELLQDPWYLKEKIPKAKPAPPPPNNTPDTDNKSQSTA